MTRPFEIDRSREPDGGWRVTILGPLDHGTVGRFDVVIDALVVDAPATVVIDLDGVTFLDSSGLRGLVRAQTLVDERHGTLRCERPTTSVSRVLEFAGLLEMLAGPTATLDTP